MNGGRFFAGSFVPISAFCKEGATLPTSAPVLSIYRGTTKVFSAAMPVADRNNGLFVLEIQLGTTYTDGHYMANISYVLDDSVRVTSFYFESLGGDGTDGAIIAMAYYDRPHARFLVQRLDSNIRRLVRNPRGS